MFLFQIPDISPSGSAWAELQVAIRYVNPVGAAGERHKLLHCKTFHSKVALIGIGALSKMRREHPGSYNQSHLLPLSENQICDEDAL